MSSAFYFLSVAWSLLFEPFQLCSFFALTLLQSCFSAVHVHASVSVNELWFYPCGLPADHHCSFYIWKSCLIFFVVVVSHIHGMFVTLCGPVLHIIFPYCVSYSFRFLWDKRQKLTLGQVYGVLIRYQNKETASVQRAGFGEKEMEPGQYRNLGETHRSILQCSCNMDAS